MMTLPSNVFGGCAALRSRAEEGEGGRGGRDRGKEMERESSHAV